MRNTSLYQNGERLTGKHPHQESGPCCRTVPCGCLATSCSPLCVPTLLASANGDCGGMGVDRKCEPRVKKWERKESRVNYSPAPFFAFRIRFQDCIKITFLFVASSAYL